MAKAQAKPTATLTINGKKVSGSVSLKVGESVTWGWKGTNASKFTWRIQSSDNGVYPSRNWATGSTKSGSAGPFVVPVYFQGIKFVHTYTAINKAGKKAVAQVTLTVPLGNGALLKVKNSPNVYLLQNRKRRLFPDQKTFAALGFNAAYVHTISAAKMQSIPLGAVMSSTGVNISYGGIEAQQNAQGSIHQPANNFCTQAECAPRGQVCNVICSGSAGSFYCDGGGFGFGGFGCCDSGDCSTGGSGSPQKLQLERL